ncbi:MAG: DUF748 domain-containing protein [Zetaproteobacteria bacterium]|nr:DUF748 domain-containing protein [Zetaproteobacteria bacterium]
MLKRIALFFAAIILLLLCTLPWSFSPLIHTVVLQQLQQYGLAHGVKDIKLEQLDVKFWQGKLVLRGFDAGDGLRIGRLELTVDGWLPVLNGELFRVTSLALADTDLLIRPVDDRQWQFGSMVVDLGAEESAQIDATPSFQWSIEKILLQQVNLDLHWNGHDGVLLPVASAQLRLMAREGGDQHFTIESEIGASTMALAERDATDSATTNLGMMKMAWEHAALNGELTFPLDWQDWSRFSWQKATLKLQHVMANSSKHEGLKADALLLSDHAFSQEGEGFYFHLGALQGAVLQIDGGEQLPSLMIDQVELNDLMLNPSTISLQAATLYQSELGHVPQVSHLQVKKVRLEQLVRHVEGGASVEKIALTEVKGEQVSGVESIDLGGLVLMQCHVDEERVRLNALALQDLTLQGIPVGQPTRLESGYLGELNLHQVDWKSGQLQFVDLQLQQFKTSPFADFGEIASESIALQSASIALKDGAIAMDDVMIKHLTMSGAGSFKPGSWKRLHGQGLMRSANGDVQLHQWQMQGGVLPAQGNDQLGTMGSLNVEGLTLRMGNGSQTHPQIQVQKVVVEQAALEAFYRDTGWFYPLPPTLVRAKTAHATNMPDHADAKEKVAVVWDWQVNALEIQAGSIVHLHDETVVPHVVLPVEVKQFVLKPLSIGYGQWSDWRLSLQLAEHGMLTSQGTVMLDHTPLALDATWQLKDMPLPPLSAYVERYLGAPVKTGQMDIASTIHLRDGAITADNVIGLRQFQLRHSTHTSSANGGGIAAMGDEAIAGSGTENSNSNLGMPVSMALGMLRDDHDNISIKVPVKGLIDDPTININDAIKQAMLSATKTAALSSASLLLQPYGSILPAWNLAKGIVGYLSKPRLTPVIFSPMQTEVHGDGVGYMSKIAQLLTQKPQLNLQICGFATRAELKSIPAPVEAEVTPLMSGEASQDQQQSMLVNDGTRADALTAIDDAAVLKRDEIAGVEVKDVELEKPEEILRKLASLRSKTVVNQLVDQGVSASRLFDCTPEIEDDAKAVGRVELLLH